MTILAVDDERLGLEILVETIKDVQPDAEVVGFRSPLKALEFAKENDFYIAFLDIQMPRMTGIELAQNIKIIKPAAHIVFATGYDEYMGAAFNIHANGYIQKPVTPEKVRNEIESINLMSNVSSASSPKTGKTGLRFQCFGNFECFFREKPVHFKYDKTKEVLAYIVSRRGALCSNAEIILNVWDDDADHDSYLRGIRKDMVDTFKDLGIPDVLSIQRGKIGINPDMVECDYYNFMAGDAVAINSYQGEFMVQYSWSELTNAELDSDRYQHY